MAEQQPQPTSSGQNKKRAFFIVGLIVALGLSLGYFYNAYRKTHVATDDAFIEGNNHTISARVNGSVRTVAVTDNQPVKKGDLLVEIDPADYDAKFREADSALQVEKAKLAEAETRIRTAQTNLELAQANLTLAQTDRDRAEKLIKEQVIPQERYDRAVTAYAVARAQVAAAEEQLRQAESQKVTQQSVIRQKEATAGLAKLNFGYTRLYAPVDGYVTRKSVQTGNQVRDGQPLMAVVDLDSLYVIANYKETELEHIRPGHAVRISVDAYPGRTFIGKVEAPGA